MNRDCKNVQELLDQYLTNETTKSETRRIERHLASCPDCAQQYKELKEFKEMMAGAAEEPPEGMSDRILGAVRETVPPIRTRFDSRFFRIASVAAALIFFVSVAVIPFCNISKKSQQNDYAASNSPIKEDLPIKGDHYLYDGSYVGSGETESLPSLGNPGHLSAAATDNTGSDEIYYWTDTYAGEDRVNISEDLVRYSFDVKGRKLYFTSFGTVFLQTSPQYTLKLIGTYRESDILIVTASGKESGWSKTGELLYGEFPMP